MGETNKKKNENNLIDFTVIKLKEMYKQYMNNNMSEVANDIMQVLLEYQKGRVNIIWREGMPYVKFKSPDKKV